MQPDPLRKYNRFTSRASAAAIAEYSTSFSLASRLLHRRVRRDVQNLYAVVRIADEIVDGVAAAAGLGPEEIAAELDGFEKDVLDATRTGFSTNPTVHAFGLTVRRCGIRAEHIAAFFASMRHDVAPTPHDQHSLGNYIWGSAEVIGLMCLAIFTADRPLHPTNQVLCEHGARRLGAAFQKINFLRDLQEDTAVLGRDYVGPVVRDADRDAIIADITADLDAAYPTIALLPLSARTGVLAAFLIFEQLRDRLARTPCSQLATSRVRVPNALKAQLAAQAVWQAPRLKPQLNHSDKKDSA